MIGLNKTYYAPYFIISESELDYLINGRHIWANEIDQNTEELSSGVYHLEFEPMKKEEAIETQQHIGCILRNLRRQEES